jgi:type II secretory pathway component PulJ
MRAASPGLPEFDQARRRKRTKWTVIIGAICFVVLGVLALAAWQSMEQQSRQHRKALAQGIAKSNAADASLRKAVDALAPSIDKADRIRKDAIRVLGHADGAVASLAEAIDVARRLTQTVEANPSTPQSTIAGAASALRIDEEQMALVDPVATNLAKAQSHAAEAIDARLLQEAQTSFADADRRLNAATDTARNLKAKVDAYITALASEATRATPPTPSDTPEGTQSSQTPMPSVTGLTEEELEEAKKEARRQARRAKRRANRIAELQQMAGLLGTKIAQATALSEKEIDESDAAALNTATHQRTSMADELIALIAEVEEGLPRGQLLLGTSLAAQDDADPTALDDADPTAQNTADPTARE